MQSLSNVRAFAPAWPIPTQRVGITYKSGRILGLILLASLLVSSGTGWAQVTTATFSGTVTDPTGAATPDATVTLTQDETGIVVT
jgi:hypothetical protein